MPKWYQSLYWRIGIGFVLFLAAMLALQGGTLMFLISRMEVGPGPAPPEVARFVARDLGEALSTNPQLDIRQFLRQEYEGRLPLVAIMKDGRVISTDETSPPEDFVREVRSRLNNMPEPFMRGPGGRGRGAGPRMPRPDGAPPPPRMGPFGGRRGLASGVVFVNG